MNLKYIFFLFIFSFSEIMLAQDNSSKQLEKAKGAIVVKDYAKAIKVYKKLIKNNKYNVDFLLDLAELYFLTNDINRGCECAYFATMVKNEKAENLLNINCSNYKGKVKLLRDVDSLPMFLFEGKYQNLIENNVVNPKYLLLIQKELKLHKYVHLYDFSGVKINTRIGEKGQFLGKIDGLNDKRNTDGEEMKEIRKVLEQIVFFKIKYKPAIFQNEPVEIFETFYLTM